MRVNEDNGVSKDAQFDGFLQELSGRSQFLNSSILHPKLHEQGCNVDLLCFSFIDAVLIMSTGDLHCWDTHGIHN